MKNILYFNTLEDIKLIDMMRLSKSNAHDYSKDYLTLEALESGVFNVVLSADNSSELTSLSYSLDKGNTWTTSTNVQKVSGKETYYIIEVTTPTVNNGDKVLWKGDVTYNNTACCYFGGTNINFNVSGNPFSLFEDDNFKTVTEITDGRLRRLFRDSNVVSAENLSLFATTLANNCYAEMFSGCTSLTAAPELPATTLAQECYSNMFQYCTSLTTAPELPATTLAENCYGGMFYGCTSLTTAPTILPATTLVSSCYDAMFKDCTALPTAPVLPATSLANYCYNHMFNGCTALTTAPSLPATTLASGCYSGMFGNCTSLVNAPELPATTLATQCYYFMFDGCTSLNYIKAMFTVMLLGATTDWVSSVAPQGTFVKNVNATWNTTGANGVPTGWTVETAEAK